MFPFCVALRLVAAWKTAVWSVCDECQNTRFTKIAASLAPFQTTPRPQRKSRQSLFICGTNKLPRPRHPTTQIWLFISGSVSGAVPQRTHRGRGQTMRPYYYTVNKHYYTVNKYYWKLWDLKYKSIPPSVSQCCHKYRNNRRLQRDELCKSVLAIVNSFVYMETNKNKNKGIIRLQMLCINTSVGPFRKKFNSKTGKWFTLLLLQRFPYTTLRKPKWLVYGATHHDRIIWSKLIGGSEFHIQIGYRKDRSEKFAHVNIACALPPSGTWSELHNGDHSHKNVQNLHSALTSS